MSTKSSPEAAFQFKISKKITTNNKFILMIRKFWRKNNNKFRINYKYCRKPCDVSKKLTKPNILKLTRHWKAVLPAGNRKPFRHLSAEKVERVPCKEQWRTSELIMKKRTAKSFTPEVLKISHLLRNTLMKGQLVWRKHIPWNKLQRRDRSMWNWNQTVPRRRK